MYLYKTRKVTGQVFVCIYNFDIGFWECSDSEVFFLFFILVYLEKVDLFRSSQK